MTITPEQVDRLLALVESIDRTMVSIRDAMDRAEQQRTQGYRVIGEQLSDIHTNTSEILDEMASEQIPGLQGGD
jgi:hypothetical protein